MQHLAGRARVRLGRLAHVAAVLVVEDNADLRDMYEEILSIGSHATRTAETADEAIAALTAARPDVIVLDLGIAGGITPVMEALRAAPALAGVHVILASGARDLVEQATALGTAYLQKPFAPELLLAAVERAARG
jgi:two-component system nitrogen regulation response regulator NtrX